MREKYKIQECSFDPIRKVVRVGFHCYDESGKTKGYSLLYLNASDDFTFPKLSEATITVEVSFD